MATPKPNVTPEMQQRIQKILDNQEPPPNEMVSYLVDQLRQLQAESAMVSERTTQTRQQLQRLEESGLRLQGALDKTFTDIVTWVDRKPGQVKVTEKDLETPPAPQPTKQN